MQVTKCDGCGKEAPKTNYNTLSSGWGEVTISTSGNSFHSRITKEFCPECLKKWGIEIPPRTAAEQAPAQEKLVEAVIELIEEEVQSVIENSGP